MLSAAGAIPGFGVVPDAIDWVYTLAELPFGKSTRTDLALATTGIFATAAPVVGDGPAAALKVAARASRVTGNVAADAARVAGRVDDVVLVGKNTVKSLPQTGAGSFVGSADEAYAVIRASSDDVAAIAGHTRIKPANIQKVKDHLFNNTHLLDRYESLGVPSVMGRFDSDAGIAAAWQRLSSGGGTVADMQLLRHEAAEAWFMRRNGPSYNAAHGAAQSRYPAPNLGN